MLPSTRPFRFQAVWPALTCAGGCQNNGIISFTLCASRTAGVAAGVWLILIGVIGKARLPEVLLPNTQYRGLRGSSESQLPHASCCLELEAGA